MKAKIMGFFDDRVEMFFSKDGRGDTVCNLPGMSVGYVVAKEQEEQLRFLLKRYTQYFFIGVIVFATMLIIASHSFVITGKGIPPNRMLGGIEALFFCFILAYLPLLYIGSNWIYRPAFKKLVAANPSVSRKKWTFTDYCKKRAETSTWKSLLITAAIATIGTVALLFGDGYNFSRNPFSVILFGLLLFTIGYIIWLKRKPNTL